MNAELRVYSGVLSSEPFPIRPPWSQKSRWTWSLLHVMACLKRHEQDFFEENSRIGSSGPIEPGVFGLVSGIIQETGISRSRAQMILSRMEGNGLAIRRGKKGRAVLWGLTDKGDEILKIGMSKRLSRRNNFDHKYWECSLKGSEDYTGILRAVKKFDAELKKMNWQHHLRYEVFRAVPLHAIEWCLARVTYHARNAFAYTYGCLLGGKKHEVMRLGNGKRIRIGCREKEWRRVDAFLNAKLNRFAYDIRKVVFDVMLANPKPGSALRYAFDRASA